MYRILEKQFLSPTIARFVIHAPFVAPKRKPGNFVIVRLEETGERIPLTIVDGNSAEGSIVLIVQGIGKTTRALLLKEPGDALADVAGPPGRVHRTLWESPARTRLVCTPQTNF
jgi:ferredoxin--NADP+ reductase